MNGKESEGTWIHRPFLSAHNLTGCPAVSLPMGLATDGLPLSLQLVGPEWSEARILAIAHAYEDRGPACIAELRGMFAIAIWDDRARRVA